MRAGSRLLGVEQRAAWTDLPHNQQRQVATSLLLALEENAFALAENMAEEEAIVFAEGNIRKSTRNATPSCVFFGTLYKFVASQKALESNNS